MTSFQQFIVFFFYFKIWLKLLRSCKLVWIHIWMFKMNARERETKKNLHDRRSNLNLTKWYDNKTIYWVNKINVLNWNMKSRIVCDIQWV